MSLPGDPQPPTLDFTYSSTLDPSATVFEFNGQASISQQSVANFPTNGLTITFWLKCSDPQPDAIIVSYDAQANSDSHWLWIKNPGDIRIGFGASDTGSTGVNLADGAWHYLTVTMAPYDTTHYEVQLYIDGAPAFISIGAIQHSSDTVIETDGSLVLGKKTVGGQEAGLSGFMSEFRLWQGVWSAADIMTGMQIRMSGSDPHAVICWALTSPATSGTVTGGSFVNSDLQFRQRQLLASWSEVSGAQYNLQVSSADGCWQRTYQNLTGTRQVIDGYQINIQYQAEVQAVVNGASSTWSAPKYVLVLDLQPINLTLTNPSGETVLAQWQPVDQVQQYQIQLYKNQAVTPESSTQTTTTYDLTNLVQGEDFWTYKVTATSEGSIGPANPVTTLAQEQITLYYYNLDSSNIYLQANWNAEPGTVLYYLQIDQQTTPVAHPLLDGSTTTYRINGQLNDDTVYKARVRALGVGAIAAWSLQSTVIIHNLLAPVITSATADAGAHSITVDWTAPPSTAALTFNVELWRLDGTAPFRTTSTQLDAATFTDPEIQDGASFKVRVQATADNSIGRWSEFTNVYVSSLPQVQNVIAGVNSTNDVTVSWTAVSLSNFRYKVNLSGPGVNVDQYTTNTCVNFYSSDTHVQTGQVYGATVWVEQNGTLGPPSQMTPASQVTIGQVTPVCPVCQDNAHHVDDPINIAIGSYNYSHTDIQVNAPVPLTFITTYNTTTPTSAESDYYTGKPMGNRWNHYYNTRIIRSSDGVQLYVIWGSGAVDSFLIPTSITGQYTLLGIPNGSRLFLGTDMIFVLMTKDQQQFRFAFDGRLMQITAPSGNTVSLQYDLANKLVLIKENQTNRSLTIDYYGDGYLKSVTDNSGRSVSYTYENGDLTVMTDVMQYQRVFDYYTQSMLKSITDEDNNMILKNTYEDGRVIFQQDARSLASGANYGSSMNYTVTQENGVDIMTTDYTDRAGNQSRFKSVLANGNMLSAEYQLGNQNIRKITQTYDGLNNMLSETQYEGPQSSYTNGKGNTTLYTYDGSNNLLTVTNPAGQQMSFTYDNNNHPISHTDFTGNTMTIHYQGNLPKEIIDFLGRQTEFTYYDGQIKGLIKTYEDENGNTFNFEYNNADLYKVISPLLSSSRYEFDSIGRLTKLENLDKNQNIIRTTRIAYWPSSHVKRSSVWLQNQPEANAYAYDYTYDGVGNLQTMTDPLLNLMTYGYNPNNFLSSALFPAFEDIAPTTLYDYDRDDNLQKITYSTAVKQLYSFDQFGRVLTYTDPNTNLYQYTYGMLLTGNGPYDLVESVLFPTLSSDPGHQYSVVTTYNPSGSLKSVKDRRDQVTSYTYGVQTDPINGTKLLVETITLPPANEGDDPYTIQQIYDAIGRLVSLTDEGNNQTTVSYSLQLDAVTNTYQQVTTITDPLGNQTIYILDALNRLVSFNQGKDALFYELYYAYNAINSLIQSGEKTDNGIVWTTYSYQYDSQTECIKVSTGAPGNDQVVTLQYYNGLNQLVKETNQVNNSQEMDYSPWGGLWKYTNANNQTLTYGYDEARRYYKTTLPGTSGEIVQMLDFNGNRLQTLKDQAVMITRTFDEWNRLESRTNSRNQTIGYDYYPTDQVNVLTYSDNKKVTYLLDGLNRIKTVTDWNNRITDYDYWPTGSVKDTRFANGNLSSYEVDVAGRLTGISHTGSDTIIASLSFILDAIGNIKTNNAIYPAPLNIPTDSRIYTYNNANQISTYNGAALTYDNDGNLSALPVGGQLQTINYDLFDQVESVGSDAYTYDPDGLRSSVTISGTEQFFVQDVNQYENPMIEMADPALAIVGASMLPTVFGAYTLAPDYSAAGQAHLTATSLNSSLATLASQGGYQIITSGWLNAITQPENPESYSALYNYPAGSALNNLLEITDPQGTILYRYVYGQGLISQSDSAEDYRVYHFDNTGNTLARTRLDGGIVDRYAYDPFGRITNSQGNGFNPFLYSGQYGVMNDLNGLLFMRARYYSPELMSFLQKDFVFGNLLIPQTLNRYSYVTGNPISLIDPLGLSGNSDTAKIIGGIAGGVGGLIVLAGIGFALGEGFAEGLALTAGAELGSLATGLGSQLGRPVGSAFGRAGANIARQFGRSGQFRNWGRRLAQNILTKYRGPVWQVPAGAEEIELVGLLAAN
ncbi:MAG: RHS repeat-associated core domain-containing protein [Blastocatellia bacterium]